VKKSKTAKVLIIIAAVVILALAGVLVMSYRYLQEQNGHTTYFSNTKINGIDVSDMLPQEVYTLLTQDYDRSVITIYENGESAVSGSLAEFGYSVDKNSLQNSLEEVLHRQNTDLVTLIESLISGGSYSVVIPFNYSEETFEAKVRSSSLAASRVASVDARMDYNEEENYYYIIPETYGNEFDDEQLREIVREQVSTFVTTGTAGSDLSIEFPTEIYKQPAVTGDDAALNNEVNIYNSYCKSVVTWEFGSQTESIDWTKIREWLSIVDGEAVWDENAIYEYVVNMASRYNTRHYTRTFTTSLGTTVTIPSSDNEYGYTVNEDAEFSQLLSDIKSNTEVSREPVYYSVNSSYGNPLYYRREGADDLAGTYVEVSLSKQHLWFYKDYQLIVETDVVTGSVAKEAETKTGCFPLAYKESPSVLRGQDAANGYETEVTYWMPFYEGQGLHDATWRRSFGGNIYQTNGSHGCVNCPYAAAEKIYNNIEAGVAIIIYE